MLTLKHVSKTFMPGTPDEKTALNDVSLHLDEGEFVTVIGSNGAGKSTLFNAVSGVFITDAGSIFLDGKNITVTPEYKRSKIIGRLFQDPMKGTAPDMSIAENLYLAAGRGGWLGHMGRRDRERFRERLALLGMGLENRMDKPVGTLSGGQRQAVSLMMATISAPKLLLLDEHTAALDPTSAEKVLQLTRDIVREEKLTCMMITHDMQSALDLGDRTLMMHDGRILFDLKGEERAATTVDGLLARFRAAVGAGLTNDRMLLK